MGKIFTLTNDIKQIAADAIDDLIDQLGKSCTLVYPPVWTVCANCVFDPVGDKSANRWVSGGPIPFQDGAVCPLCSGAGKRADENTEVITMLIANQPSHFFTKLPGSLQLPSGSIQTKGYLSDWPKVIRSKEMILQKGVFPTTLRYVLKGEPIDVGNIIQARYMVCNWLRAGG